VAVLLDGSSVTVGGSAELSATVEGTIQRLNILYYRRPSFTHAYSGPRTWCRIIPDTSLRAMCYKVKIIFAFVEFL
jgi:hypothetical protein